jgi:hypothetical protein
MYVSTQEEEITMNRAKNRSRARFGGLLALALGVAALLAIPVVSAAQNGGADDGVHHGEKRHHHQRHHGDRQISGTITTFDADSGLLTIETRSGNSISGLVDGRTKIRCEDQEHSTGHARHARSGEAEPGDDHGGRGEAEPGDDHGGGDNSGPGSSGSGNSGPGGHDDNGAGANCTTAALVSGAVVQEADLEIEHGSARFDEVELAH